MADHLRSLYKDVFPLGLDTVKKPLLDFIVQLLFRPHLMVQYPVIPGQSHLAEGDSLKKRELMGEFAEVLIWRRLL